MPYPRDARFCLLMRVRNPSPRAGKPCYMMSLELFRTGSSCTTQSENSCNPKEYFAHRVLGSWRSTIAKRLMLSGSRQVDIGT